MVRVTVFIYALFAGACVLLAWLSASNTADFGEIMQGAAFFAGMLCLVFPPIPLVLLGLLVICLLVGGE